MRAPRIRMTTVVSALGIALFATSLFWAWSERAPSGFVLPESGDAKINLPCGGTYTLWYETRSMRNGQFVEHPADYPSGTRVSFQSLPEVKDVPLVETKPRVYETAATKRVALAEVNFAGAGTVQVVVVPSRQPCQFFLTSPLYFTGNILQVLVVGSLGLVLSLAGLAASFQRMSSEVAAEERAVAVG